MRRFTITLHHTGVFVQNPLKYVQGETTVIKDINIEGMSISQLREIIDRFVNGSPKIYYYAKPGTTLSREHYGYDVMNMVTDDHAPLPDAPLVDVYVSLDEKRDIDVSICASKRKLKKAPVVMCSITYANATEEGACKTPTKDKEHYSKLWEYRQVVLESNLGSICHLDIDEHEDGCFSDDLDLDDGDGATIISDGHKVKGFLSKFITPKNDSV
ncbi:hypothetical protein Tco_1326577 [Tanacetum coccineum]